MTRRIHHDPTTHYSAEVPGDFGNHRAAVRFDLTGGYVGISATDGEGRWENRVLLTPAQVRALTRFVAQRRGA